jgi:hypothetical protein
MTDVVRFSLSEWPQAQWRSALRDLYGRAIVRQDIDPLPGCALYLEGTFRQLPGLGLGSINCSGLSARRSAEHVSSDDLLFNLTLAGTRTISQCGREATVGAGEAVIVTGADPGIVTLPAPTRFLSLRIPTRAPRVPNPRLRRPALPPDSARHRGAAAACALCRDFRGEVVATPQLQHAAVTHVHDLIALAIDARRDAAELTQGRGARAARLRALKQDIAERPDEPGLCATDVPARHRRPNARCRGGRPRTIRTGSRARPPERSRGARRTTTTSAQS